MDEKKKELIKFLKYVIENHTDTYGNIDILKIEGYDKDGYATLESVANDFLSKN